ncbi:hypothetical protein KGQ27_02620 [Patescibacteria group bacterium]|nr:hypothetical protein [Patescibacteria group bacterium]MDE1946461.1 hypothetical protein [Patescibacteria group bacterium]MDE2011068.1 hypothetical protein [Patescibacteria group bacterium]
MKYIRLALIVISIPIIFVLLSFVHIAKNETKLDANKIDDYYVRSTVDVPTTYFSEDEIRWGDSHSTVYSGEMAYQSLPTTTITFNAYSNEIKSIPEKMSWPEVVKKINEVGDPGGIEGYKDAYNRDTEWSSRYFGNDVVAEYFDVDGDGKKEVILFLCGLFGNHCPHEAKIIKNNKEIFSTNNLMNIIETKTHNGFLLDWVPDTYEPGKANCCIGNTRTRFVYKNGKFVPVLEQDIRYFNINRPYGE